VRFEASDSLTLAAPALARNPRELGPQLLARFAPGTVRARASSSRARTASCRRPPWCRTADLHAAWRRAVSVLLSGAFRTGRLCSGIGLLRLKAVQVVDGALRECCGLEDCAAVVLENLKPCGDVGRVVLLDFRRDFEIGAKERRAQLGDEFLARIPFVAPDLTAKVTLSRDGCLVRWMLSCASVA
jgi:hypothetical protein